MLYKGHKSSCEGRMSQQIWLILLRSSRILSFEAIDKTVRVLVQTMKVL